MARVPKVFFLLPVMTNHLRDQIYAELKSKQKSDLFASYVSMLLDLEPDVNTISQYENKWLEEKRLTDRQKRQLRRQAFEYLQNKVKQYYSFFAFYHDLIKEAHLWRLTFLGNFREIKHLKQDEPYRSIDDLLWWGIPPIWRTDFFIAELMSGKKIDNSPFELVHEAYNHIGSVIMYVLRMTAVVIYSLQLRIPVFSYDALDETSQNIIRLSLKSLLIAGRLTKFNPDVVPQAYVDLIPLLVWLRMSKPLQDLISRIIKLITVLLEAYPDIKDERGRFNLSIYIRRMLYALLYSTPALTRDYHQEIKALIDDFERKGGLFYVGQYYDPQITHVLIEGSTWFFFVGEREKGSEWLEKAGYFTPRSKPIYISRVWKQAKLLKAMLYENWEELHDRSKEFADDINKPPHVPHVIRIVAGLVDLIYAYEMDSISLIEKTGDRIYHICRRYNVAMPLGRWARYVARQGWRSPYLSFWDKARTTLIKLYHENPFLLAIEDFIPLEAWLVKKRTGQPLHRILMEADKLTRMDVNFMDKQIRKAFSYPSLIPNNWLENFDRAIEMIERKLRRA